MIRIVTTARLRELREDVTRARARTREVQEQADQAFAGHVRSAFALTARAERAEWQVAAGEETALNLQLALEDTAAQLTDAQAELARRGERIRLLVQELEAVRRDARSLVVLLHYGEPYSIHRNREAAEDYAATLGVDRHGWEPMTDRPAREVAWRMLGFTAKEGSNDYLAA